MQEIRLSVEGVGPIPSYQHRKEKLESYPLACVTVCGGQQYGKVTATATIDTCEFGEAAVDIQTLLEKGG